MLMLFQPKPLLQSLPSSFRLFGALRVTTPHATLQPVQTPFDNWRSIAVSLYMTLVGYGVLVAIPVISSARVALLGFTEEQAGRLSSADLGGLAAGAAIGSLFMATANRRLLVLAGAMLTISANALCIWHQHYEPTLYLRILAGVGSGIYTSVAVANLGASSNPARAYNLMLFAFAFSQALELQMLPKLTMDGIYAVFIAGYLLGLLVLHWIPVRSYAERLDVSIDIENGGGQHHPEHRHVPAYLVWLCLAAMCLTYVNIGAYWTYIELAAHSAQVAGEFVNRLLVWGSLASVLGCLLATLISNRLGLARPLLMALLLMALAVGGLGFGIDTLKLAASLLSFNLLWIFIDVYQMAFIANADHSGTFSSLIPTAQGVGQIVGPNIAASLLADTAGYDRVFLVCALFAVLGLLTYLGVYLRLKSIIPALADAP